MPSGTAVSQGTSLWLIKERRVSLCVCVCVCIWGGGGSFPTQRVVKHMEGRCGALIWQRNEKKIAAGLKRVMLICFQALEYLTVRKCRFQSLLVS